MSKYFTPIDRHDGNVVLIFSEQFGIRSDVDLFEGETVVDAGAPDCQLGVVAEVAARP
jgi:hypothetical protein